MPTPPVVVHWSRASMEYRQRCAISVADVNVVDDVKLEVKLGSEEVPSDEPSDVSRLRDRLRDVKAQVAILEVAAAPSVEPSHQPVEL